MGTLIDHPARSAALILINDISNVIIIWWLSAPFTELLALILMKAALILIAVYFLHCEGFNVEIRSENVVNNRPIIGILAQELSQYLQSKYPEENYSSYIAASYVKDVEASAARVVPIMIGKDRSYYRNLMTKINGVLFPGGGTYFNQSDGYADAGQHIYEIAKELNDAGDYFPIFGTCLGFELMIILASDRHENRIKCNSHTNLRLNFTKGFRTSKMFHEAPDDVIDILANDDVTVNAHNYCITDDNINRYNLSKEWRVTSHSNDDNEILSFIASVEHSRYPFFGVQFHPEKSSFEWKLSKHYPHYWNAVKANRYFMDFFVKECRKNFHRFANVDEENNYLIYNYVPHFVGILGSAYHQCYFFEPRRKYSSMSKVTS